MHSARIYYYLYYYYYYYYLPTYYSPCHRPTLIAPRASLSYPLPRAEHSTQQEFPSPPPTPAGVRVRRRTSVVASPSSTVFSPNNLTELKSAVDEWSRGQWGGCNPRVWTNYHRYGVTCDEADDCTALVDLEDRHGQSVTSCEAVCSLHGLACVQGWQGDDRANTWCRDPDCLIKSWKHSGSCDLGSRPNLTCDAQIGWSKYHEDDIPGWDGNAMCRCKLLVNTTAAETTYGQPNTWDVSRVTNMHGLFESKIAFDEDINNWDTSRVTDMNRMFYVCFLACPASLLHSWALPTHRMRRTYRLSPRNLPQLYAQCPLCMYYYALSAYTPTPD